MPTTPDDPVAPRRRLGLGPAASAAGSADPAVTSAASAPASHRYDAAAEQAGVEPEPESEPAAGVEPEARSDDMPVPEGGGLAPAAGAEPSPQAVPAPAGTKPRLDAGDVPVAVPATGDEAVPVPAGSGEQAAPAGAGTQGEPEDAPAASEGRFTVRLANFEGPFDLLLQLISKHKLDVTEVALSKVTNEFMAHLHAMGPDWDLDQTTEFLVVAATLLDLKAARLLPAAEVEDEADLALLEARDLLFARLLQYRAYKQIAAIFAGRLETEARSRPRTVGLEPQHAELLPEVVLSIGPERFAQLAVKAMQPRPEPQVYVDHIHAPLVSVREQADHVIALLRERGAASFGELTADAEDTLTVVARFLALLELYREKAVILEQPEALGVLHIRWTGGDEAAGRPLVTDEFDPESTATRGAPVRDASAASEPGAGAAAGGASAVGASAAPVASGPVAVPGPAAVSSAVPVAPEPVAVPAAVSAVSTDGTTAPGPSGEGDLR